MFDPADEPPMWLGCLLLFGIFVLGLALAWIFNLVP